MEVGGKAWKTRFSAMKDLFGNEVEEPVLAPEPPKKQPVLGREQPSKGMDMPCRPYRIVRVSKTEVWCLNEPF